MDCGIDDSELYQIQTFLGHGGKKGVGLGSLKKDAAASAQA